MLASISAVYRNSFLGQLQADGGCQPELNRSESYRDYVEWVEHCYMVILSAKVRKHRDKSPGENAVGILDKGIFRDLEDCEFIGLEQFNNKLWKLREKVNNDYPKSR